MPGTAARGTLRGRALSAVLGIGALCAGVGPAGAEDAAIRSQTTAAPQHQAAPSRSPNWQSPQWYPQAQAQNRRPFSGMSAANVPPGYYQQSMSWNGPTLEQGPIYPPSAPYVVYVGQPLSHSPPEPAKVVVVNQVTVNNPPPVAPEPRYEPRYAEPQPPREAVAPPAPRPTKPQRVVFEISPADAQVKLDGKKLGSGAELAETTTLELAPGVYILQVEHPAYKSQRLVFGVSAELVRVEVDLASEEPSSRARVR